MVKVEVKNELVAELRVKENLGPDMPAKFVVEIALRELLKKVKP
jgi:hypothetical protein